MTLTVVLKSPSGIILGSELPGISKVRPRWSGEMGEVVCNSVLMSTCPATQQPLRTLMAGGDSPKGLSS